MFVVKTRNVIVVQKNYLLNVLRLRHKLAKRVTEKTGSPVATDVRNYLDSSSEYEGLKDQLPKMLLKKYKTPESMYLINAQTAKKIANTLQNHLSKDCPLVEVNPGLGLLSEELLKQQSNHIYMYEQSSYFLSHLNNLQKKYPGRITHKVADFFGMWKLAFKDKLDQGNRITDLLGDLSTSNNDRIVKIVGSMPGLSFVHHMIYNILFHNATNQMGRPDLFITMPGYHYEYLTDSEIQLNKHKSVPVLFQLLFDSKILTDVPKVHFLPWTYPQAGKRVTMAPLIHKRKDPKILIFSMPLGSIIHQVPYFQMDEHRLYLVNITQKEKLPCPSEYLPLLWYFFKPRTFSKSTRVIPMLEQWIPGCGVWLISGQDPPDCNKDIAPTADDAELPHMTIFTEFGDLSLRQKITVFKKFVSWPEFEQCPFRVTMENNLPKTVVPLEDDDKESIATNIDDMDASDTET